MNLDVNENEFKKFVDTGKVSLRILKVIAKKIIIQEELTSYETAIFYGMTAEINKLILKLNKANKL